MNVLIMSWRGPGHPHSGGAELVTHEHAKVWIKAGHSVSLFTSSFPGAKRSEVIDGVKIVRYGKEVLLVQIAAFFWYMFHRRKFDLIIDHFHGIPFFTPLFVSTRKLVFIHEVAGEVWKLNPWPKPFNFIPALLGPIAERLIFRLFYKNVTILTVSESTRADLVKLGIPNENIFVVPNGVVIRPISKGIKKEKVKTAMYLGAITTDKGIDDAVKVFSEINSRESDWQYWIVGKGGQREISDLRKSIQREDLQDKVKVWGYVDEKLKFELLKRSHVLINPSVHEGWGLVNIEANAMKTPVIAYDVSGNRDSIVNGKTGILVSKGDYSALASEAIELISKRDKYEKMKREAYTWSKKFSWEKSGKISIKLIDNLR